MVTTLLAGGTLIDLVPPRVRHEDLLIVDGKIADPSASQSTATRVDVTGCLLMPGLILAHTHLYGGLAIGMPSPKPPPQTFREILERVWWRLDRALDAELLALSARVAAVAALRAGVTCVIDHHESPSFIHGSLDIIEEALREVGLRGGLCYGVTDRHGHEGRDAGLAECARFIQKTQGDVEIRGMVGIHAPFTANDDTLEAASDLSQSTGAWLHYHAAEGPDDQEAATRRYGRPLLEHLDTIGLVHERTLLAHGVNLSSAELERIRERRAFVTHQARSNMNNGVGYARGLASLPRVALGTDGIDGDLFAELGAAFFRRREAFGPSEWPEPEQMLGAGHALAREIFGLPFGRFEPGAPADLTVLAYDPPTPLDSSTVGAHLIFGIRSHHVRDVFVSGRPRLSNRKVLGLDEAELYARARAVTPRLHAAIALQTDRGA